MFVKPATTSRAKALSSASKNGFETPSCTYQKVSPVAATRRRQSESLMARAFALAVCAEPRRVTASSRADARRLRKLRRADRGVFPFPRHGVRELLTPLLPRASPTLDFRRGADRQPSAFSAPSRAAGRLSALRHPDGDLRLVHTPPSLGAPATPRSSSSSSALDRRHVPCDAVDHRAVRPRGVVAGVEPFDPARPSAASADLGDTVAFGQQTDRLTCRARHASELDT